MLYVVCVKKQLLLYTVLPVTCNRKVPVTQMVTNKPPTSINNTKSDWELPPIQVMLFLLPHVYKHIDNHRHASPISSAHSGVSIVIKMVSLLHTKRKAKDYLQTRAVKRLRYNGLDKPSPSVIGRVAEEGSINSIVRNNNPRRLFVKPIAWTSDHL